MTIPKHDEIWLPALQLLGSGSTFKSREFEKPLAEHFGLTEEETGQLYESGKGLVFYDRMAGHLATSVWRGS